MAEKSAIEWTDATVNFWWGCTKVGPGCDHCYAETWAKRLGFSIWGVGAPRREIRGAVSLMAKLQAGAAKFAAAHGRRRRVFIQSMSDLFDLEVPVEWFAVAWGCIVGGSDLDVQIVTKRASAVEKRLAQLGKAWAWPNNAGLVISVVNQTEADRDIPRLLALKAKFGIPWVGLSMEPLLGPVTLGLMRSDMPQHAGWPGTYDPLGGSWWPAVGDYEEEYRNREEGLPALDWVIVGGESGPGARPMHPDWARSLRDQCSAAGVPILFKQWGEWGPDPNGDRCIDLDGRNMPNLEPRGTNGDGTTRIRRLGKAAAGRLLDGVAHNGFPA
jgi:protein gp37